MKYYFYSAVFIILAIVFTLLLPNATNSAQDAIISFQIPQNNAQVAGVEKYNSPPYSRNLEPPIISARAVLIKDLITDTILYQKNANTSLPIASTTKIMTALIGVSYFKPNSVLSVNQGASISGSRVGLLSGEDLNFRSLLYGMLLSSGNDAAFTIAENYPGGVLGFVSAMNKKVSDLNLKNTHFDNPAGFDSVSHYSSAFDLAIITHEALKDSQLARIFATKDTDITSLDKKNTYQLHNLNKLLSDVSGVLGVKTGTTEAAKENLITLIDRGGHRVLIVLLGSNNRFGETKQLIDWTYSNFVWQD